MSRVSEDFDVWWAEDIVPRCREKGLEIAKDSGVLATCKFVWGVAHRKGYWLGVIDGIIFACATMLTVKYANAVWAML